MDYFKQIMARVRDGIVIVRDGAIRYANPALVELFGCRQERELLGVALSDFLIFEHHLSDRSPSEESRRLRTGVALHRGGRRLDVEVAGPFKLDSPEAGENFLIVRDVTKQRNLERELLQMANTAGQRLARDLHDGLGQELAAIGFQAAALQMSYGQSPEAAATVAALLAQVEAAGEHVRQLAHGLDASIEGRSIGTILENLARNTEACHPVSCTCSLEATPSLPFDSVLHLQRIAQEAIRNAIRHGQARKIQLTLRCDHESCILSVSDNGAGFSGPVHGSGIGLRIMGYRAKEMAGRLDLGANPSGGTTVVCRIPLPRSASGSAS